jgi:hypothetical protein
MQDTRKDPKETRKDRGLSTKPPTPSPTFGQKRTASLGVQIADDGDL